MLAIMTQDVVWYDAKFLKDEEYDLDDILYSRFKRAGYIKPEKRKELFEPIIKVQSDKNELSSENSGDSKPTDDSVGKNASKRGTDRRNK